MLGRFQGVADPVALTAVAGPEDVAAAQAAARAVKVDETMRAYILGIIAGTRQHKGLRLGASPRASLALQHASQARAAMQGRAYVLPDDVKALAAPVLAHRIIIDSSARLRGKSRDSVIAEVVAATPVPIER